MPICQRYLQRAASWLHDPTGRQVAGFLPQLQSLGPFAALNVAVSRMVGSLLFEWKCFRAARAKEGDTKLTHEFPTEEDASQHAAKAGLVDMVDGKTVLENGYAILPCSIEDGKAEPPARYLSIEKLIVTYVRFPTYSPRRDSAYMELVVQILRPVPSCSRLRAAYTSCTRCESLAKLVLAEPRTNGVQLLTYHCALCDSAMQFLSPT
jgi:hypothetical protein